MKASIVTIGDELLLGQIIDTNSTWLSQQLTSLGVDITEIRTISDDRSAILKNMENLWSQSDLIIMTGGLGPTKDDITKKTIADFFGLDMVFDQKLFDKICQYFDKYGIPVTEMHRQQCYMPKDTRQLDNNMGTAPGMLFEKDQKWLLSLPGVPYEMKWIFENGFVPLLKEKFPEYGNIYYRTIKTAGIGETRIAEKISDIADSLPKEISLAYLPSLGHVKLRLTTKDKKGNAEILDQHLDRITKRLGNWVYGFDSIRLEEALRILFKEKALTLSTAESCTGGFLSHKLTSVPGSSEYFMGSIISYDNALKENLLNVPEETLTKYGAVSEETVLAMLKGALQACKTDVAIAISGIAGPGGGSVEKPVGTIWMAWGNNEIKKTKKLQLSKDRLKNIEFAAVTAMNSLRLFLTEL